MSSGRTNNRLSSPTRRHVEAALNLKQMGVMYPTSYANKYHLVSIELVAKVRELDAEQKAAQGSGRG